MTKTQIHTLPRPPFPPASWTALGSSLIAASSLFSRAGVPQRQVDTGVCDSGEPASAAGPRHTRYPVADAHPGGATSPLVTQSADEGTQVYGREPRAGAGGAARPASRSHRHLHGE